MIDNRNTILAVILSGLVLIGWQYFFNIPQMEKQRAAQQAQSEMVKPAPQAGSTTTPQTGAAPAPSANAPATNQPASAAPVSRDTAIASAPRVKIETPRVTGSISLKGARIDDLALVSSARASIQNRRRSCCSRPRERLNPITPNSDGSRPAARR
jgi:YidC/Oxa1 family membrane protein insertase